MWKCLQRFPLADDWQHPYYIIILSPVADSGDEEMYRDCNLNMEYDCDSLSELVKEGVLARSILCMTEVWPCRFKRSEPQLTHYRVHWTMTEGERSERTFPRATMAVFQHELFPRLLSLTSSDRKGLRIYAFSYWLPQQDCYKLNGRNLSRPFNDR